MLLFSGGLVLIVNFKRGFAAGILIAIGCTVYLLSESKTIGAFLFTVALSSICTLELHLFTGRICFLQKRADILPLVICLVSNVVGCLLTAKLLIISNPSLTSLAQALLQQKLNQSVCQAIILAIFCGLLMAIAVETYKKNIGINKYLGIFLCVPTFIICGFEHSIADLAYFLLSNTTLNIKTVIFIACVLFGNSIGGILMRFLWSNKEIN